MRFDLQIIASPGGPANPRPRPRAAAGATCSTHLRKTKQVRGYGIEIDEKEVIEGIEKGLSIVQGDLNEETRDFADQSFDYVILSQTLQQVYNPEKVIEEMLRVGKYGDRQFPLLQPSCHQTPAPTPQSSPGHRRAAVRVV